MRALVPALVVVLSVLTGGMRPLWAQTPSLGDLARQEEERRKTITSASKVYTNKDLGNAQPPPEARPSAVAEQTALAAAAALAAIQNGSTVPPAVPAGQAAAPDKDKGVQKDQTYWAGRMKDLDTQLDRDQTYVAALQTQVNTLTTDFINKGDDVAQRATIEQNRQKALGELARLQKEVEKDTKAIADLDEEARRAGAPPGWLR
jgi:hypothetical protein